MDSPWETRLLLFLSTFNGLGCSAHVISLTLQRGAVSFFSLVDLALRREWSVVGWDFRDGEIKVCVAFSVWAVQRITTQVKNTAHQ